MSDSAPMTEVVSRVYFAQRHAGTFGGRELTDAACAAADLSRTNRWYLKACDPSGERILGVASTLQGTLIADTSRRLDGLSVLLVAGVVAGPLGFAQQAAAAQSLGAAAVHGALIGGWDGPVPGCEAMHQLTSSSRPVAEPHGSSRLATNSA